MNLKQLENLMVESNIAKLIMKKDGLLSMKSQWWKILSKMYVLDIISTSQALKMYYKSTEKKVASKKKCLGRENTKI